MEHKRISGKTRTLGLDQGWTALHVRDQKTLIGDNEVNIMWTEWTPTPEELIRLNAGHSIFQAVLGVTPPPTKLQVGDPDEFPDG